MDSSRRAVESYWRSRMVDGATADDDKVTPVYKLEEICELLRTSHASIVKEVSELIIKRLDHKSPIVKQKALKLVKYSVGKSGADFKREMQRHSAAFRQLLHYKGNLDPLKGDAINKAVRDTSQEAISILFSSEESKSANPAESINNRIEGFGNTNYEEKVEEKKSFLSEVVGLGSASIIQGLTSLAASHSSKKIDGGTYKSPNLRRSLTTEIEGIDRYEPVDEYHGEKWHPMGSSRTAVSGSRNSDSRNILASSVYEQNSSNPVAIRSREERLLETIVTSGGVRLQPTRDALHTFMVEASKMDPLVLSRAIEMKLQSHVWQVRMKAICVLESIIRKKDEDFCAIIESYFSENNDTVVKCCELPQASLREKANKVLTLLGAEHNSTAGNEDDPTDVKAPTALTIEIPDLIDTGGPDDDDPKNSNKNPVDQSIEDLSTAPLFDDLFEDPISNVSVGKNKNEDDPFADVSFHGSTDEKHSDIFSGLAIDDKKSDQISLAGNNTEFDIFGSSSWHAQVDVKKAQVLNGSAILDGGRQRSQLPSNGMSNGTFGLNSYYPMAAMQHSLQPSVMFNPALAAQPMSYGSMEAYIAQQQLLYQNIANINSGYINATGISTDESYSSALPDIFHLSTNPVQNHSTVVMASLKKDETKAFDFISEHMSSARDSKRIR